VDGTGAADPESDGIGMGCSTTEDKRDFAVDGRSMQLFASKLEDDGWMDKMDEDLEAMNRGKCGRPFSFPDSLVEWGMMQHANNKENYRLTVGRINHRLRKKGYREMSLTQFYDRARSLANRIVIPASRAS